MAGSILVTGATGFIGRELCTKLEQQGYKVIKLSSGDGNIYEPSTLLPFSDSGISHVFHLAGSTFVPASWETPHEFIRTNVLGTSSVLDFCLKNKCSLTYVSAYIYGSKVSNPIAEDTVPEPNNPYALSKKMGEDLCRFYDQHMGLPVTIVRPFNVYGPGQGEHFLIPFIIRQIKHATEVRVKDLEPRRDYIHVSDVADCLIKAMEYKGSGVFNSGTGRSFSVREVIEAAMQVGGVQLPVISEQKTRTNEISDTVADISRARTVLGWEPRISLAEGIRSLF